MSSRKDRKLFKKNQLLCINAAALFAGQTNKEKITTSSLLPAQSSAFPEHFFLGLYSSRKVQVNAVRFFLLGRRRIQRLQVEQKTNAQTDVSEPATCWK